MWERLVLNLVKKYQARYPEHKKLQKIIGDEVSEFLETNSLTDKSLRKLELNIEKILF
jgi:hypothetical protein